MGGHLRRTGFRKQCQWLCQQVYVLYGFLIRYFGFPDKISDDIVLSGLYLCFLLGTSCN